MNTLRTPAGRSTRPIFAITLLLAAVGLGVLLSSQHRLRIVLGSYSLVDSAEALNVPPKADGDLRWYASLRSTSSSTFAAAISSLQSIQQTHPLLFAEALPAIDDPDTCLSIFLGNHPMHCYNADIAATRLLERHGIYARLWDVNGARSLGGLGHNLLEVWDEPSRQWLVIDPYYRCYFTKDSGSAPISFAALRHLTLTQPARVQVRRYAHSLMERLESDIIAEHQLLDSLSMLHANNDFRWRYDHRYGMLMPLASFIDGLKLRTARAVRTFMLGRADQRFVVNDRFAPHYHFHLYKILFYVLASLVGGSVIGLLLPRRHRKAVPATPSEPQLEAAV